MRIVSGILKGRKIYAPKGYKTRPTSDRVREAIFNVLGDIKGLNVLDFYAGTGALSFEALSRGANKAILVDSSYNAVKAINKNAANLDLSGQIQIFNLKAEIALRKIADKEKFGIIFADPPYGNNIEQLYSLINKIKSLSLLCKEGIMVCELNSKKELINISLNIIKEKKYGDTKVYFLKNE